MADILGTLLLGTLAYARDNAVSVCGLVGEFAHHHTRVILRILQIATEKWTVLSAGVAKLWADVWHGGVPSGARSSDAYDIPDSSSSEALREVVFAFATRKRDFTSVGLKLKAQDDKHRMAAKPSKNTATGASTSTSSAGPASPAASVAPPNAPAANPCWELSVVRTGPPSGQTTKNSCNHWNDWPE